MTASDIALGLACAALAISLASLIYTTQLWWRAKLLRCRLVVLRWRAKRHLRWLKEQDR
jgi:hypothetical protein